MHAKNSEEWHTVLVGIIIISTWGKKWWRFRFSPSIFWWRTSSAAKQVCSIRKIFRALMYNLGNGLNSQVKEKIIRRLIWIHPSLLLLKDVDCRVLLLLHLAWLLQWPNSLCVRLFLFRYEVGFLCCWIGARSTCGFSDTVELGANKLTLAYTWEQTCSALVPKVSLILFALHSQIFVYGITEANKRLS